MKPGKRFCLFWVGLMLTWGCFSSPIRAQESGEFFFSKGMVAYSEKKFEEALTFFQKAVQLNPERAEDYQYLGMTQTQLGRYDPAIRNLEKALSLNPALKEIHYDLGVTYFRMENYPQALIQFQAAQEAQPDQAMAYFYPGYLYYLTEKYPLVGPQLDKAQALDPALTQSCQFYRGLALMRMKKYPEAGGELHAAIQTDPSTELAEAAKILEAQLSELEKQEKRWSLSPSISLQYDSNVTLEPDALPTATAVSDQEDFRTVFYLPASFRLYRDDRWSLIGFYSFYQSIQASLHDFDLTNNQVNLLLTRKLSLGPGQMPSALSLDVNYTNDLLGGSRYLDTFHVRSTWSINPVPNHLFQLQWWIQPQDFHFSILSPKANRDGIDNQVGFNHFWFHANNTRYFRWGFFYDRDSTIGSDWDYDGYRVFAGYFLPIWNEIRLTLDGEYYYQDYQNRDSFFARTRSDREYTYSIACDRNLGANLNLALLYLNRQHNSNIEFYEYDRNVYMLTLSAYF